MNHQRNTPASLDEAVALPSSEGAVTELASLILAGRQWGGEYADGGLLVCGDCGAKGDEPHAVNCPWHDDVRRAGRVKELAAALAAPGAAIAAREQEAPELLLGWKRYEKARKLSPLQWNRLHIRNLAGENFDAMIDSLPEPTTPVPTPSEALSPATVAQPMAVGYFLRSGFDSSGDGTKRWEQVADEYKNDADVVPLYAAQPCASQGCGGAESDEQLTDVIQIVRNIFGGHSVSRNAPHWKAVNEQARASIRAALSTAPRSLDGATPGGNDHG